MVVKKPPATILAVPDDKSAYSTNMLLDQFTKEEEVSIDCEYCQKRTKHETKMVLDRTPKGEIPKTLCLSVNRSKKMYDSRGEYTR
jgi:hypothetical protein